MTGNQTGPEKLCHSSPRRDSLFFTLCQKLPSMLSGGGPKIFMTESELLTSAVPKPGSEE